MYMTQCGGGNLLKHPVQQHNNHWHNGIAVGLL
jgi:hypothetical protein